MSESEKGNMQVDMSRLHSLVAAYYKALYQRPCVSDMVQLDDSQPKKIKKTSTDHEMQPGAKVAQVVYVYGKDYCPFCREAKQLVDKRENAMYIEMIDGFQPKLTSHTPHIDRSKTIPIVFVDERHLGGLSDMKKFFNE